MYELDERIRNLKTLGDNLRQERNKISSEIGSLMREKMVEKANSLKEKVVEINNKLIDIEKEEEVISNKIKENMMTIPNIIDDSVPIGKMIAKM